MKNKEMLAIAINKLNDIESSIRVAINSLLSILGEIKATEYALEKERGEV